MGQRGVGEKPLIGVMPLWDDERDSIWMLPGYMDMIRAIGGIPIVFPLNDAPADVIQLAKTCNGLLFTGGHDVSPALYEEESTEFCGIVNEVRDRMEVQLLQYALVNDVPCLGICRGAQLMNAALGGTLYQDLETELPLCGSHKMTPPYNRTWHEVNVVADTPLHLLLRTTDLGVNSCHHQGIKDLSFQLKPMAYASDGLIEAVYHPGKRFFWGVQWHPEMSWENDFASRAIAQAFLRKSMTKRWAPNASEPLGSDPLLNVVSN